MTATAVKERPIIFSGPKAGAPDYSWAANHWTWVISFRVVKPEIRAARSALGMQTPVKPAGGAA